MRTMASLAVAMTVLAAMPARAQTYDPAYPVCLQVWGMASNYISCRYTSIGQCQVSARGRAAQCLVNPYFAGGPRKGRTYRGPQ
ncbi:MAG TPA: DUF3551 domain-containing protein [Bradyrhizobium sp.]|nr:DUF3551 domain-containing protein [Bradyrhizobium sp.]